MKKNKIIGLFFLVVVFLSLPFISNAQFVEEESNVPPSQETLEAKGTLDTVFTVINIFLVILFMLAVISLFIAGIKFIIAGGNEGVLEDARKMTIASAISLFLALFGYIILSIIRYYIF